MNLSKFLVKRSLFPTCFLRKCQHNLCPLCPPPPPYRFNVTLMNATTPMGEALAFLLKQHPIIEELRLYDDKDTIGIGMDLSDIDTSTKIAAYTGEEHLKDILLDTHIVINCDGYSNNPYESYEDIFEKNAEDIRRTAIYLTEFNPNAVFCIAKPPVESLVPLAYEEYKKVGLTTPGIKIIGCATYTMMRASHYIAKIMKTNAFNVTCPIIGGVSPETAIAVISGSNPGKKIQNPRHLFAVQDNMAYAEEKVLSVKINEEGGAVAIAPAVAAFRLVDCILKGLRGDHDSIHCAFVRQEGHLKKFLPYLTSIVQFGRYGVHTTHMPDISGAEVYRLERIYKILRAYIHLGENYVHGFPTTHDNINENVCEIARIKTEKDVKEPYQVKLSDPSIYDRCARIEKKVSDPCETC